tara:strand:+ start:158 stop:325 length:168 start_codon:yes stop_codon:yes gene_type:complete
MEKDIIVETLRKLTYKNISMDTTKGRNHIADELLKSLKEEFYLFNYVNTNKKKRL